MQLSSYRQKTRCVMFTVIPNYHSLHLLVTMSWYRQESSLV